MVAKSEASMPMSRALAKLAVATDLGTAARPSTAVPLSYPAGSTATGDRGGGTGGKAALTLVPGRNLVLKPSAARNVLASLPLPLSNLEGQHKKAATAMAAATAPPPQAGSGTLAAAAAGPATPRLPPLPTHIPPQPPSPQAAATAAVAAAVAQTAGAQLLPATPPTAQQTIIPHPQQRAHSMSLSAPPLPPCGISQVSSGPGGGGAAGSNEISKELRDAARNHPGLPAGLLAQLHHPRRPGMPASAPFLGTSGSQAAAPPPPASGGAGSAGGIRPLSPRSRARLTASLVNGSVAVSPPLPAAPPLPPTLPAPAAMAALSPEALEILLGPPSSQPPPPTAGGLLVMRRAGPVAGTALRPSTAQQSGSSGGVSGPSSSSTAAGGPPKTASSPSRPPVVPHITVPYKPGSIRLPPGGVPGITAAVALVAGSGKGPSGPGSAAGSGTGSPAVPSTAGAAAGKASPSELLRPWTSAGGAPSGTLRPVTANPLTHCMPTDSTTTLVVRVPRSATEVSTLMQAAGGVPAPPSRAGDGPAAAAAKPGAATSARGLMSERSAGAGAGPGAGGGDSGETNDARQLTAQELRAVVAALAAARPEAATILLQRPGTAVSAAGTGDMQGRPVSSPARRPATRSGASGANDTDAAATGALWDLGSMYGKADGNPPPGSANSRTSSRATTRGSLLSESAVTFDVSIRDPSVYDDKWPRPTSGGARPSSRGATAAAAAAAVVPPGAGGGGGNSRSGSDKSQRQAISAWGSTRRPLQSIPEDGELAGGEEVDSAAAAAATVGDVPDCLQPLEPLESDPILDAAWASIVAANQRPDTAAARAPSSGLNVFSRPPTGAIRITRQAAPMVLVLEDLTASTPEVLERELENLGLEDLQRLRTKLCG
ncbi:hypothetical protein Vretimale_9940 [Volvox reticuliferus]|uniref:Uncharacterized protein n=1 Tax=Volvox reticuliferus TaxID=1737510 RepID=A0A8J4CN61_9CHLO|nr:hypothetical protein Vretifemale_13688 [Volvox reticuliferus]GIM05433.1 hypothetical protein Vretimale_9940 [Volvox reticuliferus]